MKKNYLSEIKVKKVNIKIYIDNYRTYARKASNTLTQLKKEFSENDRLFPPDLPNQIKLDRDFILKYALSMKEKHLAGMELYFRKQKDEVKSFYAGWIPIVNELGNTLYDSLSALKGIEYTITENEGVYRIDLKEAEFVEHNSRPLNKTELLFFELVEKYTAIQSELKTFIEKNMYSPIIRDFDFLNQSGEIRDDLFDLYKAKTN